MATRGAVPAAVAVAVICAAAAVVSAASSRPHVSVPPSPPPSGRRVGIIYEPWHAPAYWAMENATLQMSIEQLVRSNGTSKMSDVLPPPHNLFSPDNGMGFWWHATPAGGRYCIYRKRDDEAVGCVALTPVCKPVTRVRTVSFPARALTSVSLLWFIGATETMQPLCRRTCTRRVRCTCALMKRCAARCNKITFEINIFARARTSTLTLHAHDVMQVCSRLPKHHSNADPPSEGARGRRNRLCCRRLDQRVHVLWQCPRHLSRHESSHGPRVPGNVLPRRRA